MGFGAVFSSIFVVWLILISFLVSPVHLSRSCLLCPETTTVAAANKAGAAAKDNQTTYLVEGMGTGASSSFVADKESKRQLREAPRGSDPVHHDNTTTARR